MKRRLGMAAAVALMVLGVPAVASAKPAPLVCGSDGTLTVTGKVKLTTDLTCTLAPLGGSVINLAGHTLTGNIDPSVNQSTAAAKAFTVKNGTVTGFVIQHRDTALYDLTIQNATIDQSITVNTGNLVIRNSHVQDAGVFDVGGDSTFTITHNTMANFIAQSDFPGSITGRVAHNTLTGTITVLNNGGPPLDVIHDRDNTCAGVPC